MRKLILEVQLSIDGFVAEVNGDTNWMLWNWRPDWKWDNELQKYHTDLTKSVDGIFPNAMVRVLTNFKQSNNN